MCSRSIWVLSPWQTNRQVIRGPSPAASHPYAARRCTGRKPMHVRASPLSAPVPASRRRGPTGCLARQPFGSHHWHVKVVPGVLRGLLTTSTRHPDLNLPGRSQSPPDPLCQRSLPARVRIPHTLSRRADPAGLLIPSITAPAPEFIHKRAFLPDLPDDDGPAHTLPGPCARERRIRLFRPAPARVSRPGPPRIARPDNAAHP